MIAGSLLVVVVARTLWRQPAFSMISDRPVSRRSVALVCASIAFLLISGWFCFNELNFLRKGEAVRAGEAILIESGQRDSRFVGTGWYPAVQTEEGEVRISRADDSFLEIPMQAGKEYSLILRLNPAFQLPRAPAKTTVFLNGHDAGQIEARENISSAYVLRVSPEWIQEGINRLQLRMSDSESGSIALAYWKIQPVEEFQRGMEKFKNGEFDEAIALFEQSILQAGKRRAPVYFYLGKCYLEKGDAKRAAEYLTQALALSRGNPEILEARGEAYLKTGQFEDAVRDLTKVLKNQPDNEHAKQLLAEASKR
jgi:hypothetical protein